MSILHYSTSTVAILLGAVVLFGPACDADEAPPGAEEDALVSADGTALDAKQAADLTAEEETVVLLDATAELVAADVPEEVMPTMEEDVKVIPIVVPDNLQTATFALG